MDFLEDLGKDLKGRFLESLSYGELVGLYKIYRVVGTLNQHRQSS